MMQWVEDHLSEIIVVFVGLSLLAIVGSCVQESRRPGFELKKADWRCTAEHTEYITTLVAAGNNTYVPIITPYTVCDQWTRK